MNKGRCLGVVVFDLDLGQRDRLEQLDRRRQRLEALGTLSSGIAHDLNNLLTPILMSSKTLLLEQPGIDRRALLETICTGASRGAELIEQLLTFARGGEGHRVRIELDRLLIEVVTILERTLAGNIKLELRIDDNLPAIQGDATEISQVVMNLAINARDAMPKGGELVITAEPYELSGAVLCVFNLDAGAVRAVTSFRQRTGDSGRSARPYL